MSADNWAVCPRCEKKRVAAIHFKVAQIADAYRSGVASFDEVDRLQAERAELEKAQPAYTFREDYEIRVYDDGEFSISYEGRCTVCDLKHHFRHAEWLPTS